MRSKICTVALTGLLTLGLAGSAAFAQEGTTTPPSQTNNNMHDNMQDMHHNRRGMSADQKLQKMTKKLDLSADQQSQIKPILESEQQQMEQLRQDTAMSRQDRQQKMMEIRQDSSQKIEAVLNDTQKQKYESMNKWNKGRHMQHEKQGTMPEQQPQ